MRFRIEKLTYSNRAMCDYCWFQKMTREDAERGTVCRDCDGLIDEREIQDGLHPRLDTSAGIDTSIQAETDRAEDVAFEEHRLSGRAR